MLFPVFSHARNKARQATCQSNLKQLGKAFVIYATDYSGRFPAPGGYEGGLRGPMVKSAWVTSMGTGLGKDIGGLWNYVMQRGNASNSVWSCPNAIPGDPNLSYSPGQNYVMNDYLRAWHPGEDIVVDRAGFNLAEFNVAGWCTGINPDLIGNKEGLANVILLYEGAQYKDYRRNAAEFRNGSPYFCKLDVFVNCLSSYTPPLPSQAPQNYHAGKSNFLFCDGHVAPLAPGQTYADTPKNRLTMKAHNAALYNLTSKLPEYTFAAPTDKWNPDTPGVSYP
jgi:prepilin-type processing-associated H-X9-DG protein